MAHVRIDRKGFLASLGVAAAACVARPAAAATARLGVSNKAQVLTAVDLPMKARPAARIVAQRRPGA